jgi:hypothetical protein
VRAALSSRTARVFTLIAAVCACAPPRGPAGDAGADAGPDAGIDAGADAGPDAGADGGPGADTDSCGGAVWSGDIAVTDDAGLSAYDGITHVAGSLSISGSGVLSLEALSHLVCVDGDLDISDCPALSQLGGPTALAAIGGNLIVGWNVNLSEVTGLSALSRVGGSVWLTSNAALGAVSLPSLESVGLDLIATENGALSAFEIPLLSSAGGDLEIGWCDSLERLDGLGALSSIGGVLHIESDASLTSLDGVGALEEIGAGVHIEGNAALPTCRAEAIVDQVVDFEEPVCITGNAADACPDDTSGCGDLAALSACGPASPR